MRVAGLNQAIRNVNDGISMVQITEERLMGNYVLKRMRDLTIPASNASLSSTGVATWMRSSQACDDIGIGY